jgi:hypothetical protein
LSTHKPTQPKSKVKRVQFLPSIFTSLNVRL